MQIHLLHGSLVHVGIFLDSFDQFGDARGAVFDFVHQAANQESAADPQKNIAECAGRKWLRDFLQFTGTEAGFRQAGRDRPAFRHTVPLCSSGSAGEVVTNQMSSDVRNFIFQAPG